MAEAIDTAFVDIVPDFRNFNPAVQAGIRRSLAGEEFAIRPTVDQRSLKGATTQTNALTRSLAVMGGQAGRSAQVAALGVGAVGLAGALAVGKITRAGIQFESAFAGVRKTVNASSATLNAIRQDFIDLSTEIPVTTTELSAIGEAAGQLGIQTAGITEFTKTVAELGVTTNLTSDQAADALARLANITQLPQDQFDNLGATIVALGNRTAATESEIVDFGLRIAGSGKQIGLTQAEILSFGAALASVGLNAEAGGTAISTTFIKIASAVDKGGKQLDAFASVAGESAAAFASEFQTRPAEAITRFIAGLGRVKAEGGSVFQTLDQLGLGGIRVRDALLRAAGSGDLLRSSIQVGNTSWQKNNALQREAAQRFGTTASQIQLAKNQVTALAIELSGPFVRSTGAAAGAFASFIGGIRGGIKAIQGLGDGPDFDAANADLGELITGFDKLQGQIDDMRSSGGFVAPSLTANLTDTRNRIDEIGKALTDSPGGLAKWVRVFSASSDTIRQAISDGVITPLEQGEIQATASGRAFLRALPPDMFQSVAGSAKSAIEDTVAGISRGATPVGAALRSMIEDASAQAKAEASTQGKAIGESLASGIAQAATQAVKRAGVVTAVQDEAVDAAIASGSRGDQLAALKKKRDALANAISKIEAIKNPSAARVKQRRELRAQLASAQQQIDGIESGIVADQQAAEAAAKQKADDARTAAIGRDRAFVEGLTNKRGDLERAISSAGQSGNLKLELRLGIRLRDTIRDQIEQVKQRVKDVDTKNQALRVLRDALAGVIGENKSIRKDIADTTAQAIADRQDERGQALSDITEIATLRGDKAGQEKGLRTEIAFWRKVALSAKAGSKAQRDAILEVERKRQTLRELLRGAAKDSTDTGGGTSLADLFTQTNAIARQGGLVARTPGIGVQPIEDEVQRRLQIQGQLPKGKLSVDAAVRPPEQRPDPQIDRLIAALVANTEAVRGNSGTGSVTTVPGADVTGKRWTAVGQYYQAQARRKARLDRETRSGV